MKLKKYGVIIVFIILSIYSYFFDFEPGIEIFNSFGSFSMNIVKFIFTVFILIGIFEVWVKKETVEKHLGEKSTFLAYIWAFILGTTTIGGLYVALPISKVLYDKGARLDIVLTFLGAASVARIPMTLFEASFLGIDFTIIRLLVSIILIIITSKFIEKIFNFSYLRDTREKI